MDIVSKRVNFPSDKRIRETEERFVNLWRTCFLKDMFPTENSNINMSDSSSAQLGTCLNYSTIDRIKKLTSEVNQSGFNSLASVSIW